MTLGGAVDARRRVPQPGREHPGPISPLHGRHVQCQARRQDRRAHRARRPDAPALELWRQDGRIQSLHDDDARVLEMGDGARVRCDEPCGRDPAPRVEAWGREALG